jgi:hypothetical protein
MIGGHIRATNRGASPVGERCRTHDLLRSQSQGTGSRPGRPALAMLVSASGGVTSGIEDADARDREGRS